MKITLRLLMIIFFTFHLAQVFAQEEESESNSGQSEVSTESKSSDESGDENSASETNSEESNSSSSNEVSDEKDSPEDDEKKTDETKADEPKVDEFEVQWYQPEYEVYEKPSKKGKTRKTHLYKVTFLGKTSPQAKVKIGSKVYRVRGKKINKLSTKKLMGKKSLLVKVEEDGVFKIPMIVPHGSIQIPVAIKVGKTIKKMQLIAKVNKDKIEVKDAEVLYTACENCIWMGFGFGILNYKQDPPQNLKPIDYGSITAPNFSLRGSVKLAQKWNLRWDAHSLTAQDLSSSDLQVSLLSKAIAWNYYGLEAEWKAFSKGTLFGYASQTSLIFGVQSQAMPFVIDAGSNQFSIGTFSFNSLSLGGVILLNAHKRWQYEAFMRLQVALSGDGDVKLDSGFAFDGSIGTIYNMTKSWKLGIFWNGQYHGYNYSIGASPGTYSLLASQFDFSLGYHF
ncbi:MAG: hypothetical protein KDD50_12045 [Bdellovibrionales bacterium]|nr:hypothetical protein [Bdellovibrionales bacterium]